MSVPSLKVSGTKRSPSPGPKAPGRKGAPSVADSREGWWLSGPALVMYIAALKLVIQLIGAMRYGYFTDELYYLACAEHLDWGYIDHPPFVDFVAFLVRHSLGVSLFAIRIVPALAGALQVCLVGAITRRVGGGRFAQGLAALGALVCPVYLHVEHYLHLAAFEPVIWTGLAYLILRAIQTNDRKYWLGAGLVAGIGLENKYSVAVLIVGLLLGLLWGRARQTFLTANFWAACGVALLVFLPNLLWQMRHGWAFLTWQETVRPKHLLPTYLGFMRDQMAYTLPVCFLWIAGLWFFLATKRGKPYRFLGVGVLFVIAVFELLHGKTYYPTPAYGIAFAGGATLIEEITKRANWRWIPFPLVLVITGAGAFLAPCYLPLLPIERVAAYQNALSLVPLQPARTDAYEYETGLPPEFSNEFGWEEIVSAVGEVYNAIPDSQKPRVGIFAASYAEAGAIDLMGSRYGLPKAMSAQLAYKDWGTRNFHGDTLIVVALPDAYMGACMYFLPGPFIENPYGYEKGPIVNLCRGGMPDVLTQQWERMKAY